MRLAKLTRGRTVAVALTAAVAAAGTVGIATTSQAATATYTVSPKTGPGGTNAGGQPASGSSVIAITGTGFKTGSVTNVNSVRWVAKGTACSATATALATFSVPSATRIVATVPANELALTATTSGGVTTYSKKDYTLCVYNGTPTLMGQATYSVYPVPTITAAVTPTSGSASGGETVTVVGTGFTSATKVKFGSVLGTKVKVAKGGTSLTVIAPAQAATGSAVNISVTTEGGTNPTPGTATWDDYTYVNAVTVSPKTSPGSLGDVITVKGVGFTAAGYDWTSASTVDTASGVFLFTGAYAWVDTTADDGIPDNAAGICGSVQIVSDTELVCTLTAAVTDGAYTVYVVEDKSQVATASAISSTATYTVADF
jgi:hypothetical protein